MCNMAAYAGTEPAAPKLFRMLQSQEYLGGGHYNGIATIHEGKIHMIKVIGTTDDLLRRHPEVLDLPGTVGIAHSRTPGYDSDEWAQPFFAYDEKVIYCANGASGRFTETNYQAFYDEFKKSGIKFRTARNETESLYPVMDDGTCLHSTELAANIIGELHKKNIILREAMHQASVQYPSEIAGLALSVNEPDTVSAIRINQPLMWGRDKSGFYLATAAFGLENEKINWINRVPHSCCMTMSKDDITFSAMDEFDELFMDHEPLTEIYAEYDRMLAGGSDYEVDSFCQAAARAYPKEKMAVANMIAYEYLREKMHANALEYIDVPTPGSGAGLTAPRRRYRKNNNQ